MHIAQAPFGLCHSNRGAEWAADLAVASRAASIGAGLSLFHAEGGQPA